MGIALLWCVQLRHIKMRRLILSDSDMDVT